MPLLKKLEALTIVDRCSGCDAEIFGHVGYVFVHSRYLRLKQVPEELIIHFVVILYLRCFDKCAQQPGATIGGRLL